MKAQIKNFILRGLLFSSGGPLIYGIVILIIDLCGVDTMTCGVDIFKGIISTFLLAFCSAGISVIWQNEKLGIVTQSFIHGITIYLCYLITYLLNDWIPKEPLTIIIYSIIFFLTYLIIWIIVYFSQKQMIKKLNQQLK